jgi:hypothetical protein
MLRKLLISVPALVLAPLLWVHNCAAQSAGRIAGSVVDASGTPQMGATVSIEPEEVAGSLDARVFTDARGRFLSVPLAAGLYSVNVTLAGFLPSLEQHVNVDQLRTTVLRVRMGTAFASLERSGARTANGPPSQRSDDADDWTWVLRGATVSRPILRWSDDEVEGGEESSSGRNSQQPRAELAVSAGTYQPGSITNFSEAPTTSFAYDMNLGTVGHLLMAGAFSYIDQAPAGGFDTLWVQQGGLLGGETVTGVVFRQSELGPDGSTFRGMRLTRQSQMALGDRLSLRYGGEMVLADLNGFTSSLRPNVEITTRIASQWRARFILDSRPWADGVPPASGEPPPARDGVADDSSLQSALISLNSFPALLEKDNRPVLQAGWHEEAAVERRIGQSGDLIGAAFHDQAADSAVFGEGSLPGGNLLPDYFSNGFAYDAGSSGSWGARVVYRQKIGGSTDVSFLYTWAGVLAPGTAISTSDLSNLLATRYRHSAGARISAKAPRTGTRVTAGYVWVSGPAVGRIDPYGEASYGFDPFLSFAIHQPLPTFFPGHMMLVADVSNLLAQGYVPISTPDGQVLLIPAFRAFQGGVSFQF